jgi:hypothetical protein
MKDLTDWVVFKDGYFYIDGTIVEGGERFTFCHGGKQFCGVAGFDGGCGRCSGTLI